MGSGRTRANSLPLLGLLALVAACGQNTPAGEPGAEHLARDALEPGMPVDTAIFAGGCFWCMEPPFDRLEGVVSTTSGYTGGHLENPRYEQVTAGGTGHAEAVRVVYRPDVVSYGELLDVFWRNVDPLDGGGQFCDRGDHYRSGIFYLDVEQEEAARRSMRALEESGRFDRPIVTEITSASEFWEAEEYHQGYYLRNPDHYRTYRVACGRDERLEELWARSP